MNRFRLSQSCYECANNANRLDRKGSERIECQRYRIDKQYLPGDWVCDDYVALHALSPCVASSVDETESSGL